MLYSFFKSQNENSSAVLEAEKSIWHKTLKASILGTAEGFSVGTETLSIAYAGNKKSELPIYMGGGFAGLILQAILSLYPDLRKAIDVPPKKLLALFKAMFNSLLMWSYHLGLIRDVVVVASQLGKDACSDVNASDLEFFIMLAFAALLSIPHAIEAYDEYLKPTPLESTYEEITDEVANKVSQKHIKHYFSNCINTSSIIYGFIRFIQSLYEKQKFLCLYPRLLRLTLSVGTGLLRAISEYYSEKVSNYLDVLTKALQQITFYGDSIISGAVESGHTALCLCSYGLMSLINGVLAYSGFEYFQAEELKAPIA